MKMYQDLAEAILEICAQVKSKQNEFLALRGLTIEQARMLTKIEQNELQKAWSEYQITFSLLTAANDVLNWF